METEVQEPSAVVEETAVPTVEVPEAPETVSAGAEPASTEPPVSDRPRDASGRFMKRDGTPVAPDEQAALEAQASVPATPTTSPAPQPPSSPAGEPFVFRADGQKIPIPGSMLTADGALSIPADQVPVIRQLLAEGVAHRGSWRQKESEYQRRIEEAGSVEKAKADKYNQAAMHLFDTVNNPEWLQTLVNDPERTLAYLRKDLGYLLKEADLKAPQPKTVQTPQQPQEVDQAQLAQAFGKALSEEIEDRLDDPKVKALFSPEERKELTEAFVEQMNAFYAEHEGQVSISLDALDKAFQREVRKQQMIKQAAAEAAKAREFNEKRNAPAPTLPPVVSTKGPGSTGSTTKKFQSREEWRKSMGMS
jgi:hypothetical protein